MTGPLYRRLEGFLGDAKTKLAAIQAQTKDAKESVAALMLKYGENLSATADEDACKKFFTTIATFAKSFHNAIDDNIKKRLAAERKIRIEAENNKRALLRRSSMQVSTSNLSNSNLQGLDGERSGASTPTSALGTNDSNNKGDRSPNNVSFPTSLPPPKRSVEPAGDKPSGDSSSSSGGGLRGSKMQSFPSSNNLFSKFHSAQEDEDSGDEMIEKFRAKLQKG